MNNHTYTLNVKECFIDLLVPVLIFWSKVMVRTANERSSIKVIQMDNLKRFAGYEEDTPLCG